MNPLATQEYLTNPASAIMSSLDDPVLFHFTTNAPESNRPRYFTQFQFDPSDMPVHPLFSTHSPPACASEIDGVSDHYSAREFHPGKLLTYEAEWEISALVARPKLKTNKKRASTPETTVNMKKIARPEQQWNNPFLKLPAELHVKIVGYLDITTQFAFKITCVCLYFTVPWEWLERPTTRRMRKHRTLNVSTAEKWDIFRDVGLLGCSGCRLLRHRTWFEDSQAATNRTKLRHCMACWDNSGGWWGPSKRVLTINGQEWKHHWSGPLLARHSWKHLQLI